MTILGRFYSRIRVMWYSLHGVACDASSQLESGISIERGFHEGKQGHVALGHADTIAIGACLHAWGGSIRLGSNVFIGPYSVIYGHGGVEIGAGTLISMHCRILSSNHTIPAPGIEIRSQPDIRRPTKLGRDVWLGAGVTVLGGVTIGDGCVVGAGAVVTHDLPPHSISVGIPAVVKSYRR